jgi:hypothetical protein
MMVKNWKQAVVMAALTLAFAVGLMPSGYAVPDLRSMDTLKFATVNKEVEVVTVLRDYYDRTKFYYVPNRPRLVEHKKGNKTVPEFTLLKFQFRDGQELKEGGILQFSVQIGLQGRHLEALRKAILIKYNKPENTLDASNKDKEKIVGEEKLTAQNLKLSAIPIKKATFQIFSPQDGFLLETDTPDKGVAPTFASQSLPCSFTLTGRGVSIINELMNGTGGVPVTITLDFAALTPPAGFKIEANWDVIHKKLTDSKKLGYSLCVMGMGPSISHENAKIREELTAAGAIKIEEIEGENADHSKLDTIMQPFLLRINQEMLEAKLNKVANNMQKQQAQQGTNSPFGFPMPGAGMEHPMKSMFNAKAPEIVIKVKRALRQLAGCSLEASFTSLGYNTGKLTLEDLAASISLVKIIDRLIQTLDPLINVLELRSFKVVSGKLIQRFEHRALTDTALAIDQSVLHLCHHIVTNDDRHKVGLLSLLAKVLTNLNFNRHPPLGSTDPFRDDRCKRHNTGLQSKGVSFKIITAGFFRPYRTSAHHQRERHTGQPLQHLLHCLSPFLKYVPSLGTIILFILLPSPNLQDQQSFLGNHQVPRGSYHYAPT